MRVFGDTFYFLALINASDPAHDAAREWAAASAGTRILTTTWVMTEIADAMCRRDNRRLAVDLLRGFAAREDILVLPASHELFEAGLTLYESRPDKDWSLTDCLSFVVMQREGLADALTGDRHFQQAGFRPLMAP